MQHGLLDRGANGEIETTLKKTERLGKVAIIPLSTELRNALEEIYEKRRPGREDCVLFNPETDMPFKSRARLPGSSQQQATPANLELPLAKSFERRPGIKGRFGPEVCEDVLVGLNPLHPSAAFFVRVAHFWPPVSED